MDISAIENKILKMGQYLVVSPGDNQGEIPFQVTRTQKLFNFLYNFEVQVQNFLPLGPYGVSPPPSGTQLYYATNVSLGLTTLQQNKTITDIFAITKQYEALQIFIGVAPSPLRVYLKQPMNVPVDTMEQSIQPSTSFIDMGYFDGYDSPLNRPTEKGEIFSFSGFDTNFDLANPITVPINPMFNMLINRMSIQPVKDANLIQGILSRKIYARPVSLGSLHGQVSINLKDYGDVKPLNPSIAYEPNAKFQTVLKDGGYID